MLKRILTLFAILTGLAAVAAPAHARFAALDDVQVHAAGEGASQCQGQQAIERAMPIERLGMRKGEKPKCPQTIITIVIPTVQLQADRSRE